ncbi:EcoAI/FtnUII family type I restriction enzme subunit R [Sphaerochaeta sp.]|uniref:EcoAI/FtnUII family type I restriction enzme subunit R n=1 Tax=Sphaerochaeta sp. TaxID=1972642 RepID=UPI002FC5C812
MSGILNKKDMSEEDIKLNFITPALIQNGWRDRITMETKVFFTDGKINLRGNMVSRESPKKADYILYTSSQNPIAIVEAKDNKHSISYGLQQAIEYAQMLDIPFAYSSNGDGFMEHDFLKGTERQLVMEEFPTPEELLGRFEAGMNGGSGITPAEEAIIKQPYYTSAITFSPRYYQRIAINRTLNAIAKGQDRLLLVMATGTGKTYTAFQIVYRLLKSGLKKKILYLADRNILVDQSIQQDFAPLESTIHKINLTNDDPTTITSFEVYFSLYQQMIGDNGEERVSQYFQPDFFDLIIVDECHRGSAKEDSQWKKILDYFSGATQIGMTATPKETKYVSNIHYFGEPVYSYSLKDGIEDGFLAPFKVIGIRTNIGDGWRPYKGQKDIYGEEIEDRIYNNSDYDYNIILEDRINQVASEITKFLKSTDRMAKTIVFCANEDHAERMRSALTNINSDMSRLNPDYVVRITGSDDYGKGKLRYFISVSAQYPVIATTSQLLSTGADCKMTKLIVLDKMIGSMTEFKQIIGRGTRIRENEGKTNFTVMDFRGVSRLFADPDWDGPIEQDESFDVDNGGNGPKPPSSPGNSDSGNSKKPFVDVNGCLVSIINKTVSVYDTDGKLLRQENIIDYTRTNIIGTYASLDNFIRQWTAEERKEKVQELLKTRGINLDALKLEQNLDEVDDFDFICHIAFNQRPLTRKERAENVKRRDFLSKYNGVAREVLETLLEKYMDTGIYEIEKTEVLKLDPFNKMGKPSRIIQSFGGKELYLKAVKELEEELYRIA